MWNDEVMDRPKTHNDDSHTSQPAAGLFTVGYQGRGVSELIDALDSEGVTTVVDVRLVAWSRKRGYSRTALSEALSAAGLRYEHWRELGNPSEIRDLFKAGETAEGRRQFRLRLRNGQSSVVDRLVELASHERVALLCLEADHAQCHRDVVADEAALRTKYALAVTHL
jgi:uncharacterized protein (DUF488 family)